MTRVMITGARGQVGAELAREFAGRAEVLAFDRAALDLADTGRIAERVRAAAPDVVLNAAAYTAVDRAESEPDRAHAINAAAPGALAEECKRAGALLVHYSTDYVFDGTKAAPYVESDVPAPLNVYGASKLAGERAVAASGCAHVILRTSWVYGPRGKDFMLTMLRLAATREEVRVVDDQRGAPTSSLALARATLALFTGGGAPRAIAAGDVERVRRASGLYHATAAGETTWFGFAREIFAMRARQRGGFSVPRLAAIPTSEYPTPARRPANSLLSSAKLKAAFGVAIPDWRDGLEETLSILARD